MIKFFYITSFYLLSLNIKSYLLTYMYRSLDGAAAQ